MSELYRALPSVDRLLAALEGGGRVGSVPRAQLRELCNAFLDELRKDIRAGALQDGAELGLERLLPRLETFVQLHSRPHFRRVVNATGVVVHTNLGRSLLADEAVRAVQEVDARYSNLEFSLDTGQRGSRYSHVEGLLCELTGAEAGLVVNNNAAAVLLMLDTLARGREVVVSRGQLVEIGGSFRIPDVMAKSGARMVEVGTTNRTHLADYEQAINPDTGALLKVHTSNYRVVGFHKEVPLKELAALGRRHGLPVIEDLGSGNLFNFSPHVTLDEPTVQQVLADEATVVSFSGDKLLGGPQCGIILGRREVVDQIKKNPLNRALRIDKMTLAALEATLRLYKDPELARQHIPTLRMITASPASIRSRASRLAAGLRKRLGHQLEVATFSGSSRVGGGASPEKDLPTTLVGVRPRGEMGLEDLRDGLLATDPPVVGRIEKDFFCLDPRTLQKGEPALVTRALEALFQDRLGT